MAGRPLRDHLTWPLGLDAVWLVSPAFALAGVTFLSPIRPFDYFWALAQGRATVQLGGIARENLFLYTLPEQAPFFNQPWLGELLLYAAERLGGHTLNLLLLALLLVLSLAVAMDAALRAGARPVHVALVALSSLPFIVLGSGVRTQMFAYPCFAVLFQSVLLDSVPRSRGRLLALLAVTAFWANVHGSFVLAPAMLAARALALLSNPGARASRPGAARKAAVELAAVVAATCLNPRGPAVYGYALSLGDAVGVTLGSDVAEWQPLTLLEPLGVALLSALLAAAFFAVRRRRRAELAALVVFLALALLSFKSQRFLPWAALAAVAVLPAIFRPDSPLAMESRRGPASLNLTLVALLGALVLATFPGAPLFAYFAPCAHVPYGDARVLGKETPLRTAERLARDGYAGRIFHNQAVGGFLEWALTAGGPKPVAFVDQRFELTPRKLWDEYFSITRAEPGWQALLERHGVGTLLLDESRDRPLVDAVARDGDWRLVSQEFSYRLYIRSPTRPNDG